MSEKKQSLKGVMYGMTMVCVLSDNAAKKEYSSVFVYNVMSEKARSLKGVMCVSLWSAFLTIL